MDTVTSDMELDASGKRRGQTSKWRQWFSRRPKQESPKAEIDKLGPLSRPTLDTGAVETEENAIASSPAGIEDMNHGQAGPATSKDECEDNEADSDNGGPPAPRPDDTEAEDDGENDDEDNNQDNNQDNSQNNNQDDDEDDEEKAETRPLRDFWAEAWNSDEVGKQRRALLKGRKEDRKPAQANSKKLVDGLIAKTPAKVASYTARWGSDVKKTALGRARSILVSALTVKDLIDAGLKFDPTGYGSAAWAVVSFGLKLVQNDKELMDLTFEACGHLADLMARYSRMEAHYWERKVKNGRPLEDAMVRVYTAILVYAAEVQWSIESSISTRIRKSFLSLTGQPLEDLRRTVEEENAKLEEWQQQIDRERGDDALKKLKTIKKDTDYLLRRVDETARNSYKALGKVNEEELRELYRFLIEKEGTSQADIHKKLQREIDWWGSADNSKWKSREIRRRTSITAVDGFEDEEDLPRLRERLEHDEGHGGELGDWLLQRNEYLEWEKYPQGLLWLYGDCRSPVPPVS
ncbi:hypothetical protein B0I37DRAFT_135592 [Chaetomium sp. MPI-CAGE-AT-0009]|nr:hypothetical protein B0I37DRAFT_135592 [Chaetomium sp. MPI-CAGE-AT-0009]